MPEQNIAPNSSTNFQPVNPVEIANTFIQRFGQENGIEHLKLQKLVYYAYGWWLAYFDTPLTNEAPQVWRYGPVFEAMYETFKGFGKQPVKEPQKPVFYTQDAPINKNEEVSQLINWIWKQYGGYSAGKLSDMTHEVGTPWQIVAKKHNYRVPNNLAIDDEIIKSHFLKEAAKRTK